MHTNQPVVHSGLNVKYACSFWFDHRDAHLRNDGLNFFFPQRNHQEGAKRWLLRSLNCLFPSAQFKLCQKCLQGLYSEEKMREIRKIKLGTSPLISPELLQNDVRSHIHCKRCLLIKYRKCSHFRWTRFFNDDGVPQLLCSWKSCGCAAHNHALFP